MAPKELERRPLHVFNMFLASIKNTLLQWCPSYLQQLAVKWLPWAWMPFYSLKNCWGYDSKLWIAYCHLTRTIPPENKVGLPLDDFGNQSKSADLRWRRWKKVIQNRYETKGALWQGLSEPSCNLYKTRPNRLTISLQSEDLHLNGKIRLHLASLQHQ